MWLVGMVRSYRGRYDIIMDILRAGLGGAKKTHIMHRANLNFLSFKRYFPAMLAEGMIVEVVDPDGGVMYLTAEKGKSLLKMLEAVSRSFSKKPRAI